MVTYNAQRMLHRKQDLQYMETIQDYRRTKASERLCDCGELQICQICEYAAPVWARSAHAYKLDAEPGSRAPANC